MIVDIMIVAIVVLFFAILIVKFMGERKNGENKPYSSACGSCSIAGKCRKFKNKDDCGKEEK